MESSKEITQHLPKPKGPFVPGCMDVMLEYSQSGIFTRLYYPTKANPDQSHISKWVPWIADDIYLVGWANAIVAPTALFRLARWWNSADNLHIPTLYGEQVNIDSKLKCVILSHGYGGSRFMYSVICNELASQGYLVVALEHRDGSAAYTYYYKSKEDAAMDRRTTIPINRIYFGLMAYGTANQQVHYRADECSKAVDFLINLNNGVVPHNIIDDLKSDRKINFKLQELVGQIDLERLTIAGHSFGGANALFALSMRKEIKYGILLDPWMHAIKEEQLVEKINQPLIFINSPNFHGQSGVQLMKKYLTSEQRQMYTVLNGTHVGQTDILCVLGSWPDWLMSHRNPHVVLKIHNALILRFLKQYTGLAEDNKEFELCLNEQETNVAGYFKTTSLAWKWFSRFIKIFHV